MKIQGFVLKLGDELLQQRVRLSNLVHWANGIKEDGLTGFSFLTRDGFTGQGNQIGNNHRPKMNGMDSKWVKGN